RHDRRELRALDRVRGAAVGGSRPRGPVVLGEERAEVGGAEIGQPVAVDPHGPGRAVGAEGGELHRAVPSVCVRSRRSASKIGASLNRNRSSAPESESVDPASDRAENGSHDGTTNRSPRVTDHVLSPTVTVPEPSNTWYTDEPVSRTGAVRAPRAMRCISTRMVGSTSPPVA